MTIDYGSVCSGIESVKPCTKCRETKPLSEYHRSGKACDGRASWCKPCANSISRANRKRSYSARSKQKWHMAGRYGLSMSDYHRVLIDQAGRCAICCTPLKRPCVDHCHNSGAVRGILCHKCNIRLGGWDDLQWREKAMKYLGIST